MKNVINTSKSALETSKTSSKKVWRGRGGQVTFLRKTIVNKIINIIKMLIQKEIGNEIKEAKLFSVLMDTTMDVSGFDQCVTVLRYVFETEVKERIIGLKCVQSSTGENLFNFFLKILNTTVLDVKNCIANSFDCKHEQSVQRCFNSTSR